MKKVEFSSAIVAKEKQSSSWVNSTLFRRKLQVFDWIDRRWENDSEQGQHNNKDQATKKRGLHNLFPFIAKSSNKRKVAYPELDESFYEAMVLLDMVVEVAIYSPLQEA